MISRAANWSVNDALNEYVVEHNNRSRSHLSLSLSLVHSHTSKLRYKAELIVKRFTRPEDVHLVNELLESLVKKFSVNWEGECEKQKTMTDRAHEVLMLWGEFTARYVKQARLLKDAEEPVGWMRQTLFYFVTFSIVCPILATIPFMLKISASNFLQCALWVAFVVGTPTGVTSPFVNQKFLKFEVGCFAFRFVAWCFCNTFATYAMLRAVFHNRTPPFTPVLVGVLTVLNTGILYQLKIIKHTDKRDGRTYWYGPEWWLKLPEKQRFDAKAREDVGRVRKFGHLVFEFTFAYPILGALFNNSGTIVQAFLVPVFLALRFGFE